MSAPVDKFVWLKAVLADARIPDAVKTVFTYLAVVDVRYGGATFRIRQETLANNCSVGVRSVKRAVALGRDLKYLERVGFREFGREGSADQHRLIYPPEVRAKLALTPPDSTEVGAKNDRSTGQIVQGLGPISTEVRANQSTEMASDRQHAPTGPPKVFKKGL